ncbi:coiled-coil domain-containing protein [Bizionia psychrotolerans]|uniref:hypothetical protein n=1 Tax=Bizionia psychrotolerans TaxID=1492901 RepID=UPI000650F93A|nr:hypothetical protein [Bizionia psychrotolerans]
MQTIRIAELSIDNKKLLSELQSTKKSIDELTQTQKDLKKAGDTSSQSFVENEAKLKSLKSEYTSQIKVLQATTGANEKLTSALNKEVKSVDEAKKNNAELIQIRNQLDVSTKSGKKSLDEINKSLDANNEFINKNSSELEKQKQNIGNYPDAFDKMTGGLFGVVKGFGAATKSALAFIATPVGALLAVLAGAFALVKSAMDRSEDSTNKIKKAFSAFQGITNGLMKVLEPLGKFLIDGLVKGFEAVEKGIYKTIDGLASTLKYFGFDEQAASMRNFNKEVQEGAKVSKELADAEAKLTVAQRQSQKIQLEYQKDAEKLRQIRDNENLTIAERIQANEDLSTVLKQQLADEMAIAQQALVVANLRIQAEGESKEALDGQAEALTTIADIQERLTGQESEQLVNRVSLQKEAADKAKEFADKAIAQQEAELALFVEQQGRRAKTLEEGLEIAKQVAEKEIAILDANLKNRNITQTEYDAEYLKIKNDLAQQNAELTIDNAARELENYIQNNQSKLDNDIYFNDEALRLEQERLDNIAEKRREFAKAQFDEGVISQTEYNEAINEINEENRLANEEAELEREEASKEKQAEDLENKFILDQLLNKDEFDKKQQQLDKLRDAELKSAEATGADTTLIKAKYDEYDKELDKEKGQAKLNVAGTVFNGIADLLGKESAAGKAAAVAASIINTAQGVTKALAEGGIIGIATGALVAVAGGISIAKILSAKPPERSKATTPKLARGGILNGASHAEGGIPTPYGELEGGEAVINTKSTRMYAPLLSAINQAGGGVKFASGGILGSTSAPSTSAIIDYDMMAQAYAAIPAPVVSVEEISSVSNRVSTIETTATF